MLLALAGLLLLLWLVLRWVSRRSAVARRAVANHLLEVIARHPIDLRKSILLVRVADQYVLIGVCESTIHSLTEHSLDQNRLAAAVHAATVQPGAASASAQRPHGGEAPIDELIEKLPEQPYATDSPRQ